MKMASAWTVLRFTHAKLCWDAVARINEQKVEGDIVEAGAFKGGGSMIMV